MATGPGTDLRAVIVGAGPVGSALAAQLRKRAFEVDVYERQDDPRLRPSIDRHSLNITLSSRGLRVMTPEVRERQYRQGVRLSTRVVHLADGSVSSQPYGISPEHHLLSVPRHALHCSLLDDAEQAGARLHFGHDCVSVDLRRAAATFVSRETVTEEAADLVIGCDGANSAVRRVMARSVGLAVSTEPARHGFVELIMRSATRATGGRLLPPGHDDDGSADGLGQALHIWPRSDSMLVAKPNIDGTYSTTLFLPFASDDSSISSFEGLKNPDTVERFFRMAFPDVVALLPALAGESSAVPPTALKTVHCNPCHHGRTVLMGDAAHTMLPFYGQGINCSLEDVAALVAILDRNLRREGRHDAIASALSEFELLRRPAWDAITALSRQHFQELSSNVARPGFAHRTRLELELHRRAPSAFVPLYFGVAFGSLPYHEVVAANGRQRRLIDDLCDILDPETDTERIIERYLAAHDREKAADVRRGSVLESPPEQKNKLLSLTASYLARYHAGLVASPGPASYVHDSLNVHRYQEGRDLSAALREDAVPAVGRDPQALLSEIFDRALPAGTVHPHPGFMAHVPSGGLFEAALGDLVARAVNRFPGVWVAAPGLVQLERNVVRWFCSLLGLGLRSFGYLTTSGSLSNMMGLQCAFRRGEGERSEQVLYTSEQAHFSVVKAARLIGVPSSRIRIVPCGTDLAVDVDALVQVIGQDRARGYDPTCVVATAGTTSTGAIDDLARLVQVCAEEGLWLHVDACFGGFFRITARGRTALAGIESAHSIAVDAHKSLFLPHGTSALLVGDGEDLRATFERPDASYLPGRPNDQHLADFCDYGPELSREVRGLTAWLPIKMHGIGAFERALDRTLELALGLASELGGIDGIDVVQRHPIRLPVVTFKLQAGDRREEQRLNEQLCTLVCSRERVYVTTTVLPGDELVVRACVLNHRTDESTVEALTADVRWAMRRLPWR